MTKMSSFVHTHLAMLSDKLIGIHLYMHCEVHYSLFDFLCLYRAKCLSNIKYNKMYLFPPTSAQQILCLCLCSDTAFIEVIVTGTTARTMQSIAWFDKIETACSSKVQCAAALYTAFNRIRKCLVLTDV